jgi:hypothetical protein
LLFRFAAQKAPISARMVAATLDVPV